MKIKRHQQGGFIYTPFIPNRKVQQEEAQSEGAEKISGTFTKEVIDILKENGIPNDVDAFMESANNFLSKSDSLSSLSILGGSGGSDHDLTDIIRVHALANKVKFNKQLYDSATEQLGKERAWSEVAMNNRGQMYVYSEDGGITVVSPTEFYNNSDKYTALTNAQLMSLRESQPGLAFDQNILNSMRDTVGMMTITNYVRDVIRDFGTTQIEGYTLNKKGNIENGFRELLMGGPEGYYKYLQSSQVDKSGRRDDKGKTDVEYALDYIYSTLPENMKSLLRAKTAAEGMDPRSDGKQLLLMALLEHTNDKLGVNFDNAATASAGMGSTDATGKWKEQSYLEMVTTGQLADREKITLYGTGNTTGGLTVNAWNYGQPLDRLGNQVQQSNFQNVLSKAEIGKIIDVNSIYFGDQKIGRQDVRKLVWDGSNLKRVILPVVPDGQGGFKPAFESVEQFEKLQTWIDDHPGVNAMAVRDKIRKEFGLDATYNEETGQLTWDKNNVQAFFVLDGYASRSEVDFKDSKWVTHITSDEMNRKELRDMYNNMINYGDISAPRRGPKLGATEVNAGRFRLYRAPVFMPIIDAKLATVLSSAQEVPRETYQDMGNRARALEQSRNLIRTFNE